VRVGCRVLGATAFLAIGIAGLPGVGQAAEPLDDRFGTRTAPMILLARTDVQADLKLTAEQIDQVNRAGALLYWKAYRLRGKREAAVLQARRAIDDEATTWLKEHLTEWQYSRLHEIDLQWEGVGAMLSRPIIAESLSIDPDQQHKLLAILATRYDSLHARQPWTIADQEHLSQRVLPLLTPNQRELWARLLGPPVRFSFKQPPATDAQIERARASQSPR
jgi:hypothetical protein